MFKTIEFKFKLSAAPFENLQYRDKTVLILPRDINGKYLLGTNDFYPDHISRLLGGGVDEGEDIVGAAARELKEETGIDQSVDQLVPLLEVKVEGDHNGEIHTTTIFVYFTQLDKDDAVASDDVSEITRMTKEEYKDNTRKFLELPHNLLYSSADDRPKFSWGDYGKVYGFIQQATIDEILKRVL